MNNKQLKPYITKNFFDDNTNRNYIHYFFGGAGFGAEIMNFIYILIFSNYKNYNFISNDMLWNSRCKSYKGLSCYFDKKSLFFKFLNNKKKANNLSLISIIPGKYLYLNDINDIEYNSLNKLSLWKNYNLGFLKWFSNYDKKNPKLLKNDISLIFNKTIIFNSKIINHYNILKNNIKLHSKYIGIHIRLGDKIAKLTAEAKFPKINYIMKNIKLILKKQNIEYIFLASDDYKSIQIIKNKLKYNNINIKLISLIPKKSTGYDQINFNKLSFSDVNKHILSFIIDFLFLKNSTYYFGSYSSNMSKMIISSNSIPINQCFNIDNKLKSKFDLIINPSWINY